jgi:integrase
MSAQIDTIKKTALIMDGTMLEIQQKSRTTRIEDSIETVPGYPVQIYLIPASKHYQACTVGRMGGKRPRISLKTESRATALRGAKDWYKDLILKQAKGESLVTETLDFKKAAEELFAEDLARVNLDATSKNKLSQSTYDNNLSIFNSALLPYFGETRCKNISKAKINGYVPWINTREGKKKLADKTVDNHLKLLSKILKKALELKFITALPDILDLSPADNPRGWFTDSEYRDLRAAMGKMITDGTKVRYVPVTEELQLLTSFMLQTYLRPGDLALIKYKHVQLKQTPQGKPYLMVYATSKTDDHYAIAMPEAVGLYSLIKALHPGKNSDDDYMFFPQFESREHAMSTMTKQFTEALKLANLKYDQGGKKRDLYSIRHTCIMRALLAGIPIKNVADNAGNSVAIIERFYGSHLRNEMAVDRFLDAVPHVQEVGSTLEHLFTDETNKTGTMKVTEMEVSL